MAAKRIAQHSAITMISITLFATGCFAFLDFFLVADFYNGKKWSNQYNPWDYTFNSIKDWLTYFRRLPDRRKSLRKKGIVLYWKFLSTSNKFCRLIFCNRLNNDWRCTAVATTKGCTGFIWMLMILVIGSYCNCLQSLFITLLTVATRKTGYVQQEETQYECKDFHCYKYSI